MVLNFANPIGYKIEESDSISKAAGTFVYDVYRRDSIENYKFWASYDYEVIY